MSPQLNDEKAQEAAAAKSAFQPIPDGTYHFILKDVDAERSGAKGPYWSWEFECIEPGSATYIDDDSGEEKEMKLAGRKMWNNTSLAAMWSFNQTFEAFGVPTNTDTDELLGKPVRLVLSTRTIQEGTRKGELANQVNRVLPADPKSSAVKAYEKAQKDKKEMAEIF